jgi:hypothetical protein
MEKDALLLANRIALLKQEESKTRKKIDETKKKSKEIMVKKTTLEEKTKAVSFSLILLENGKQRKGNGRIGQLPEKYL